MRIPAKDVRPGDLVMYRGTLVLVLNTRHYDGPVPSVEMDVRDYLTPKRPLQPIQPEAMMFVADRNCEEVTVL